MAHANVGPGSQQLHCMSASFTTTLCELDTDFEYVTAILTTEGLYTTMPQSNPYPDNRGSHSDFQEREDAVVSEFILQKIASGRRGLGKNLDLFTEALLQTTEYGGRSLAHLATVAFEEFILWRERKAFEDRIRFVRERWRDESSYTRVDGKVAGLAEFSGFLVALGDYVATLNTISGRHRTIGFADLTEKEQLEKKYWALQSHWIFQRRLDMSDNGRRCYEIGRGNRFLKVCGFVAGGLAPAPAT